MEEITLQFLRDKQSGWLVASSDDRVGAGGITTQGQDIRDLKRQITDAVATRFDKSDAPRQFRIRSVSAVNVDYH